MCLLFYYTYNKDKLPDNHILLLSDCFECNPDAPQIKPALECKARVINVNKSHKLGNEEVLQIMDFINKRYDTLDKLTSLWYDSEISGKVLEKMK